MRSLAQNQSCSYGSVRPTDQKGGGWTGEKRSCILGRHSQFQLHVPSWRAHVHALCMLASFSHYKFSVCQGDTVQCTCLGFKWDGIVREKEETNKQNDIGNSVLNKRFNFNHCLLLHHYFVRPLFSTAHIFDVKSQNHLCVLRGPQLIVQYIDLLVATGECEVSGRDGRFGRHMCAIHRSLTSDVAGERNNQPSL